MTAVFVMAYIFTAAALGFAWWCAAACKSKLYETVSRLLDDILRGERWRSRS